MTSPTDPLSRVDLTTEADFAVGPLTVSPSTGRASVNGKEQRVEPKVMEVLVVLARAGGRTVSRDQLVEACWGGRVVSEDAISRTVAKLRQLARAWEPAPFAVETVPKLGFRLMAAGGVAQAAPETEAPAAAAEPDLAPPKRSRQALLMAAAGLAAAALAAWAFWPKGPAKAVSPPFSASVEVAAFKPLHADQELSLLGSRTQATVTRLLAQNGHAAREAGAGGGEATYRIAGVVDHVKGSYSITGQIIHVESGLVLWSTRAERAEAQMKGVDGEVGYALVGALDCALDERRKPTTRISEEVFALLLTTCGAAIFGTNDSVSEARRLVEAAPDFAGGHSQLAMATAFLARNTLHDPAFTKDLLEESTRAADIAEKLDPTSPKPHIARALALGATGAWTEREAHLRRAIEAQPSFFLSRWMQGQLLRETGRLRAAREMMDRTAQAADPRVIGGLPMAAFLNAMHGDLRRAYELSDTLDTVFPSSGLRVRWTIEFWWDPTVSPAQLQATRDGGVEDGACLAEMSERFRTGGPPTRGLPASCNGLQQDWRARLLAREGDIDGAYAEIERAKASRLNTIMFVFYPEMKIFRHDRRFMPLMKELGLLEFWRTSGNWPDFCSEPDLPYDCRAYAG